jgi:acylphosphatase
MEKQIKATVSGIVQGVGFRAFVYSLAREYNLKGYVKNLYDGDVEIVCEGDENLIRDFYKRVKIGSRFSRVTNLEIIVMEFENKFTSFEIRY